MGSQRPVVLVTGVGRSVGIGAAVARRLAVDGWDVATTGWSPYDDRVHGGHPPGDRAALDEQLRVAGAHTLHVEEDLADPAAPAGVLAAVQDALGAPTALVLAHCESVDSGLLDTTPESFDRHYAVNVRASWLLIRAFAERVPAHDDAGRIVALTSDDIVGNLPYGATKGALDRIVLGAARELAHLGVRANVVDPGPVETGWMSAELGARLLDEAPLGRLGQPADAAALVAFLLSADGGWITGQLLRADGGTGARGGWV